MTRPLSTCRPMLALALMIAISALPSVLHAADQPAEQAYQSGYGGEETFGGPDGVNLQLQLLDEERESLLDVDTFEQASDPWFNWKRTLNEKYKLKMGLIVLTLYQRASDQPDAGETRDAAGGIYRFLGNWTPFSDDRGNLGRLEWRLESRSDIGGDPSPQQLGGQYAAVLNTGFPYGNDFDPDFAILNWNQILADGKVSISAGRLAFDVYLDSFAFQSVLAGFLNTSVVYNPAVGTTGVGALGAVAKGLITDHIWLGAQIYDANAVSGEFDFDTFEEYEWLKAVEVGWTPDFDRRLKERVQFTYWYKDARRKAGISSGDGWAISASYPVADNLLPFIRFGHSDGGARVAAENALSVGFEYNPWPSGAWNLAVGWAEPSEETHGPGLDDEWVIETSYKLNLTKNFSLTPDVQLLINPAKSPDLDDVWILGLRVGLTAY